MSAATVLHTAKWDTTVSRIDAWQWETPAPPRSQELYRVLVHVSIDKAIAVDFTGTQAGALLRQLATAMDVPCRIDDDDVGLVELLSVFRADG